MASTYSPLLRFEKIAPGEQAGLWGDTTNQNIGTLIEQAIAGVSNVDLESVSGDYTLTVKNGIVDQSRSAVLNCFGTAAGTVNLIIPTSTKLYVVRNNCGQTMYIKTATQTPGYELASGESNLVFCNGAEALPGFVVAGADTVPVSGGGTGVTSFTAGYLKSTGGTTALTTTATIPAADLSGQTAVANGGTGQNTLASGGLVIGNGTGPVATLTGGVNGYIPTWSSSLNTWVSAAPGASGVTSVSVTSPIINYGSSTAPNIGISSNPTFSTSVTSPTHYVGNSGSMYIWDNGGQMQFTVGGVSAAKVTSSGLGCAALAALGNIVSTGGSVGCDVGGGSSSVQCTSPSLASVQIGATGFGISRFSNTFAILLGGGVPGASFNETNGDFAVGANAYKPGGGAWLASSDARIKTNVTPLTGALDKILSLNPVSYDFLVDGLGEPNTGFIAQEVEKVMPNAVTTRDLNLAVNPNGIPANATDQKIFEVIGDIKNLKSLGFQNDMYAYLVGAIKELKAEVDSLKAQLGAK